MYRSLIARGAAALAALSLASVPALAQTAGSVSVLDGANAIRTYGIAIANGKYFNSVYGTDANGVPYPLAGQGIVVDGDQAYNTGDRPNFNFTKTGRLKVGLSSATNIAPAAPAVTTTGADLVSCVYRATPPTWLDGYTGAVSCDSTGNVNVTLASSGTPGTAAPTKAVQMGGSDGTNLRALRTRSDGTLVTGGLQEGFQLATANVAAASSTLYGGDYIFSQTCTGYGTDALQVRGPDGATFLTVISKTATDTSAGTGVTFGAGAVVQVALSGTTGCNATLTRVP